jgi:hypothetical protein
MISGMMTEEWGELKHGDKCVIVFLVSNMLLIKKIQNIASSLQGQQESGQLL